ncbi:MAG: hypothetical protein ACLR4X_04630 [Clostridia bacterium]
MARVSKADLEKKKAEEQTETQTKEVVEEIKPKTKTISRRQQFKEKKIELRKQASEIQVEVLNISDGNAYFVSRKTGIPYFDLSPSEDTVLTLDELEEVVRDAKGFFTKDVLVMTDVYNEKYNLVDIMEYLKLKDYDKAGYDYLEEFIVDSSDAEFKSKLENESRDYVKRIACKAIYLDATEEYILPRSKETILCNLLGLQLLIGENER